MRWVSCRFTRCCETRPGDSWSRPAKLGELLSDGGQRRLGGAPPLLDDPRGFPKVEHPERAQIGFDEDVGLARPIVAKLVLHDLQDTYNDIEAVRQARVV